LASGFELNSKRVEHRDQAIETTRGLAILDLMHHPGTDARSECNLILSEPKTLAFAQYDLPDPARGYVNEVKLGMHDHALYAQEPLYLEVFGHWMHDHASKCLRTR
jgi:hypothetical protein